MLLLDSLARSSILPSGEVVHNPFMHIKSKGFGGDKY